MSSPNKAEYVYLLGDYDKALQAILDHGIEKKDRTGVGCISVAGIQSKYPLNQFDSNGDRYFPLVTGRKLFPKAVFAELIWFLSGSTLNQDLVQLGCKFWSPWCDENNPKYRTLRETYGYESGDFGPIYGWQLRHFGGDYVEYRSELRRYVSRVDLYVKLKETSVDRDEFISLLEQDGYTKMARGIREGYLEVRQVLERFFPRLPEAGGEDQLAYMIDILKNDPYGSNGRRCLFSLWNPADLCKMALPPCHYTYQAIADGEGGLTGLMTQRSCDFPVGVPANIQFYSALTIMLAQQSGLKPRELIHETHDSHIYLNQIDQVKEYLSRPKPESPKIRVKQAENIYSYRPEDFEIVGYVPLEKIEIPVAV